MSLPAITLSIVSHRQNDLVNGLLADLEAVTSATLQVLLTENVAEDVPVRPSERLRIERIVNTAPKGFGANHNAAFLKCRSPFFCVLNPDIRLADDPFPQLLGALQAPHAGVAGPLVVDPAGKAEDSARRFPTPGRLLARLGDRRHLPEYSIERPGKVDWIAGMCMLFKSASFKALGGFDERFFMYLEDVDICRRLAGAGEEAWYVPSARVTHDARRGSRRDLRLLLVHLRSLGRYFAKHYP